jgi:drug/metabolite transporter (DMT)-like permease
MPQPAAPQRKDRIDAAGAALLVLVSVLLGMNQVMVKLVNAGMNPVFQAGMRSACAILPVLLWALWQRRKLSISDGSLLPGIVCGLIFSIEFFLLFQAIEYTTVARSSVMLYTMPVWLSAFAHFLVPGEKMTPNKALGLALAVTGVAIALLGNADLAGQGSLAFAGDLMAIGASLCWTAIALAARLTKLSKSSPEMQLLYQIAVSAPVLLAIAILYAPSFREMTALLWVLFAFQVLSIVTFSFMLWFWMLKVYPASEMASFAFLTPVFGVFFGWAVLGEPLTANVLVALFLVGAGIWLVNRKPLTAS